MDTHAILHYGHQTVRETLDAIPVEKWERGGVVGVWSVKDVIAHLASFEVVLVDVFQSLLDESPTPRLQEFFEQGDAFNDLQVAARRHLTPDQARAEYEEAYCQVMLRFEQLLPDLWSQRGTLPWYGNDYSLDDFIVYTFYGHKREHCGQIGLMRKGRT